MSCNTYGSYTTGCVIRKDDIGHFIERYIACHPSEFAGIADPKAEMEMLLTCNEAFTWSSPEFAYESFNAQMFSDDVFYDTATLYSLNDLNGWNEDLRMPFILVYADKPLISREVFKGNYYRNKDELIWEMRSKLEQYLPENFDYEGNTGDLEDAICC